MAHEEAKRRLSQAADSAQRAEAVREAISLGMPLAEIEAYLDWLDATQPPRPSEAHGDDQP